MSQRNILKEALEDSKALKQVALVNAKNLLMEQVKDTVKEMVDRELAEAANASVNESDEPVKEETDMAEDKVCEDLDLGEEEEDVGLDMGDDLGGEGEDEDDLDLGLSESDLQEAINSALLEVEQPQVGEVENINPDKHDRGLMGREKTEKDWEGETPPAKKDYTVKEQLNAARGRIANLAKENVVLKKANRVLSKAVNEMKLFNSKLFYANKLLQKEGLKLSNKQKKSIVEKLDKAKSLSEAKNLYEAYETTLGSLSENVKETKRTPSLSEVMVDAPKVNGKAVNLRESAFSADRMKELAGITKK